MQHRSMFLPIMNLSRATTKPHRLPKLPTLSPPVVDAPDADAPHVQVIPAPAVIVAAAETDLLIQNGMKIKLPLSSSVRLKSQEFAEVRISKPTVASVTTTITNVGEHRILLRSKHRVAIVDAGGVVELNPVDASHWKFIAVTPAKVHIRTR